MTEATRFYGTQPDILPETLDIGTKLASVSSPKRWSAVLAEKVYELVVAGFIAPCAWCKKPECSADAGSYCRGYLRCLAERVALGANDCPEERESVVRWCEARRQTWPDPLREKPTLCSECKCDLSPFLAYQSTAGKPFCRYCFDSTRGGEDGRCRQDRYVEHATSKFPAQERAEARNEAAIAAEHPRQRPELPHPWSAWSTAGDES